MQRIALLIALMTLPVQAQLVMVHASYVVEEVRPQAHEIVVTPTSTLSDDASDLRGKFDVLISPATRVTDPTGRPVNWRGFRPGSVIHVDGGLKLNVKIDADKIVTQGP